SCAQAQPLATARSTFASVSAWPHEHPEEAVKMAVEAYPQLDLDVELKTVPRILSLRFDTTTGKDGWGSFDPAALAEQISVYDKIGQ
ncbi:nitrate ABC transporter substrate-binding protein, partial [Rhizobium johnstonii]